MAISLASLRRGGDTRPPRFLICGVAGVGKTKLAADAPNPIFLQTEDGLGRIDAATFGLLRNFDAVMEALGSRRLPLPLRRRPSRPLWCWWSLISPRGFFGPGRELGHCTGRARCLRAWARLVLSVKLRKQWNCARCG
ncbi:MAG: AAA family ATPase [Roseomonas sp.]|nr:AAA family ATPase [Roseomonas sp.]